MPSTHHTEAADAYTLTPRWHRLQRLEAVEQPGLSSLRNGRRFP